MAPEEDKTVKELIDASTRADLERWFGLPSFTELEEKGKPVVAEDPEIVANRERRETAIANVDPGLLAAHAARLASYGSRNLFAQTIEVRIDPGMAFLDLRMVDQLHSVSEPRDVEIPIEIQDDLRECTPQALLRDLHRSEEEFTKQFEVVDMAEGLRFDVVAAVATAMKTSVKLPPLDDSPLREALRAIGELRRELRQPWGDLQIPNRRSS